MKTFKWVKKGCVGKASSLWANFSKTETENQTDWFQFLASIRQTRLRPTRREESGKKRNLQMELLHGPQNQWPSFRGQQLRHTKNGRADAGHTWEKKPAAAPFQPIMSPTLPVN